MKIEVITFAFAKAAELRRMIYSADRTNHNTTIHFNIILHSALPEVVETCHELRQLYDITLIEHGYNRGLARSFNDVMIDSFKNGADVIVNANDDIVWGTGDVRRLAQAAKQQANSHYAMLANGWKTDSKSKHSLGFSAVAFNPVALEVVGCFDENFFPAYHEDIDYGKRALLAGLKEGLCTETNVFHISNFLSVAAPIAADTHVAEFTKNADYFKRKWGENGEYITPFNSGLPLKINIENRRAPYQQFDRTDLIREPL